MFVVVVVVVADVVVAVVVVYFVGIGIVLLSKEQAKVHHIIRTARVLREHNDRLTQVLFPDLGLALVFIVVLFPKAFYLFPDLEFLHLGIDQVVTASLVFIVRAGTTYSFDLFYLFNDRAVCSCHF